MSQNPNEAKGFYKLSWLQRIGFGAGDMAQNLIYQTVSIWLLFFYTARDCVHHVVEFPCV